MAIVSSGALFEVLRQNNLLSQQQLSEMLCLAPSRSADVRIIAKTLIQKGWFTVYQINQLLAGHGKQLVLGPYHILDRLGKGGQSEVYKARHNANGWIVALKVIRGDRLTGSQAAEHFLQEMEAMAELDHPNIVQFWDADKVGDDFYCAMEYVEGTDLGKVVRLQNYLAPAQAAEYVRQTALGLQHAHEHNRIHRDIKPVNLYLTNQPSQTQGTALEQASQKPVPLVKILDWGLAGLTGMASSDEPANANGQGFSVVGTADYLSPEQAVNPRGVDIRGDIYSLGCTFYYLLTGQTPFDGATVMQKIMQHQTSEPTSVELLNPDVPLVMAGIVRRMMAKKPQNRFQTPAAVAMALKPLCRDDLPLAPRRGGWAPPTMDRGRQHEDTPPPSGTMLPGATVRSR